MKLAYLAIFLILRYPALVDVLTGILSGSSIFIHKESKMRQVEGSVSLKSLLVEYNRRFRHWQPSQSSWLDRKMTGDIHLFIRVNSRASYGVKDS